MISSHYDTAAKIVDRMIKTPDALRPGDLAAIAQVHATLALADTVRNLDHNITDLRSDIRDGYTSR